MMDFVKKKPGFTLIELLVVMGIVAMLSMLAVGGYTSYRRTALAALSGDMIVSQISEMRGKTVYGDFGGDRYDEIVDAIENDEEVLAGGDDAKCYGVHFDLDFQEFTALEWDFENDKIWDQNLDDWKYRGCEGIFGGEVVRTLELDDKAEITGISLDDAEIDDLYIRFFPPEGGIEVFGNGVLSTEDFDEINFLLKYVNKEYAFKYEV